jgi:hypothetical protein
MLTNLSESQIKLDNIHLLDTFYMHDFPSQNEHVFEGFGARFGLLLVIVEILGHGEVH